MPLIALGSSVEQFNSYLSTTFMDICRISPIEENAFTGRLHRLTKGRKFNSCKTYVLLCVL